MLFRLFFFEQIKLWEVEASSYFNEHLVDMYALLPTMKGANRVMVEQAIDEMVEYFEDSKNQFSNQLKWLRVLMNRANILPEEDKVIIREKLDMWNHLVYEDPDFQKEFAAREAKAEAKGEAKGARVLRSAILQFVRTHYPALEKLAQEKISQVQNIDTLNTLLFQIMPSPDEEIVRRILEKLKP